MIGAVVRNNIVENIIVIDEKNVSEMSVNLQCEIVDARPYGLTIGDLRTTKGWVRNMGGEPVLLPLLEGKNYDSYSIMAEQNAILKTQLQEMPDEIMNEVLSILIGE